MKVGSPNKETMVNVLIRSALLTIFLKLGNLYLLVMNIKCVFVFTVFTVC